MQESFEAFKTIGKSKYNISPKLWLQGDLLWYKGKSHLIQIQEGVTPRKVFANLQQLHDCLKNRYNSAESVLQAGARTLLFWRVERQ